MVHRTHLQRREVLLAAGCLAVGGLVVGARPASATSEAAMKLLGELTGGKTPSEGRVKLDMPEIAENGNTVPLTVTVESPMTEQDHVKAIYVLADGNPEPGVAVFHLSPMNGKAEVATRMRMAKTQNVIAAAQMSDGSVYMGKTEVKVTIGGCGG